MNIEKAIENRRKTIRDIERHIDHLSTLITIYKDEIKELENMRVIE